MESVRIWHKCSLTWEDDSPVMAFDLGLFHQGHSVMNLHQILTKYCTSCYVCSTTSAVLMGSFDIGHKWSLVCEGVRMYIILDGWWKKWINCLRTGMDDECIYMGSPDQSLSIRPLFIQKDQGAVSIRKTVLPGMAIPMLKIRRPNGRLIFNMEIAIRR